MTFLQNQDPTYVGVEYLMAKAEEYFHDFPMRPIGPQGSTIVTQDEGISQSQGQENIIGPEQESAHLPLYDIDTYKPWNYASMSLETERTDLIRWDMATSWLYDLHAN